MKLKSVLLEKPIRFATSAAEVYEQGGVPPRELRSDKYGLDYDPATQLVTVIFKGHTKLIHAARVELMERDETETAPIVDKRTKAYRDAQKPEQS